MGFGSSIEIVDDLESLLGIVDDTGVLTQMLLPGGPAFSRPPRAIKTLF
jgi:hypothetical protein